MVEHEELGLLADGGILPLVVHSRGEAWRNSQRYGRDADLEHGGTL
jgi:hypothetical protein